ncbi:MFS transporter (plasmid) [Pantoea agglomerans]|uniref:MFS transporter n=1 Tax=Enterobacter agglomerans TaxID=549 RepID=UPI002899BBE8|nr:MFS transporter [Pantoea agglomerans]WNK51666.1 MFS transporter [Pantoea agglomerans]
MKKYIGIAANELDTYLDYALLSITAIYIYNARPNEMGFLGACFAVPFLFSSQFFGNLIDKGYIHHWRSLFFLINSMVTPIFILTGNIYGLLAIAFVKTTARCGLNISNVKLNKNDDESKKFYEIYGYLINFSRVLVPIAVVALYKSSGMWSVIFFSSALNIVSLIFEVLTVRNQDGDISKKEHNDLGANISYSFINEVRKNSSLFYLVMGYTIANFAFFLSNDMLGLFFKHLGQSESSIGMIISLLGVGGIVGTKMASVLNKSLTPVIILTMSVMINSTAFGLFGFLSKEITSVYVFYGCIILVGMSSGITFFSIRFGVREIIGYRNAGKATGTIQLLSSIVAITMPLMGGYIANLFSLESVFRITSLILLLLMIFMSGRIYCSHQRMKLHEQTTKNE